MVHRPSACFGRVWRFHQDKKIAHTLCFTNAPPWSPECQFQVTMYNHFVESHTICSLRKLFLPLFPLCRRSVNFRLQCMIILRNHTTYVALGNCFYHCSPLVAGVSILGCDVQSFCGYTYHMQPQETVLTLLPLGLRSVNSRLRCTIILWIHIPYVALGNCFYHCSPLVDGVSIADTHTIRSLRKLL